MSVELNEMPTEVLLEIFSYFTQVNHLTLVCKRFKNILESSRVFPRTLLFDKIRKPKDYEYAATSRRKYRHAKLFFENSSIIVQNVDYVLNFLEEQNCLECVYLSFWNRTNKHLISHEFIHTIIKHLTNCKELTIDFYGNPRIDDEDLPLAPIEFSNLKVLKLPCLNLTTFINCINAKNLEVLHFDIEFRIGYNSEVCLEIFQFINSKNFEKLQKLEIKNCFRWTPKELQLNYMFSNADTCMEMLKFLKTRLQSIEKLEICKGCLKQEFIDGLVKLSHKTLQEIDIDIATNILQAELVFKNVHTLTIRRTQIKEALMIKLSAIFPEVITLAIKSSSFSLFRGHDFQRFFHETFPNLVVCDIENYS